MMIQPNLFHQILMFLTLALATPAGEHPILLIDWMTFPKKINRFFKTILSQYKPGQMIPYFEWPGTQLFFTGGSDFGTDAGACEWISPIMFREKPWGDDWGHIPLGSYPGEVNGLKVILDAEVFDNGPSRSDAQGFKVAILHNEDLAIMAQSGININVGTFTQMAVTAKLVETTPAAKERFWPQDRG